MTLQQINLLIKLSIENNNENNLHFYTTIFIQLYRNSTPNRYDTELRMDFNTS